ncbi:MAG: trypsin-like peptidase domain-containing protein [Clostridia bacterium]|nr:trypsin-like peptidase domain-containing protein [Clostridia bacterium]
MLAIIGLISVLSIVMMLFEGGVTGADITATTTTRPVTPTTRPYDENRPQIVISGMATGDGYTAEEIVERLTPSIVSVIVYRNGQIYALGSGVIMTEDGYILTCAHLINNESDSVYYRVRLSNNMEYDAQIIGYDNKTDIGVVKINLSGLRPAEFADSSYLKSGQDIWAIGTSVGFEFVYSITDGIISSPNRYITNGENSDFRVIQHTAVINSENFGGALVNKYGQVVGINSVKTTSNEYEGMEFAVSVSNAKNVIDDIIQYGTVVRRARLGISYLQFEPLSEYGNIVAENNLPSSSVLIIEISAKSDLANYDVREGDLLIGINGKDLVAMELMYDAFNSSVAGDKITLEFFRCETKETFEVTCYLISEYEF